jgi:hypothetical protein
MGLRGMGLLTPNHKHETTAKAQNPIGLKMAEPAILRGDFHRVKEAEADAADDAECHHHEEGGGGIGGGEKAQSEHDPTERGDDTRADLVLLCHARGPFAAQRAARACDCA